MALCDQCRTHEAFVMDEDAGLWCQRCAIVAEPPFAQERLWDIRALYEGLRRPPPEPWRYRWLHDPVHARWAKKLGLAWPPVEQEASPDKPRRAWQEWCKEHVAHGLM